MGIRIPLSPPELCLYRPGGRTLMLVSVILERT